jgi:mono/diheme cytochrome c family protein
MRIRLLLTSTLLCLSTYGMATEGEKLYGHSCLACHGADGAGVMPGVRALTASDGPLSSSDYALFRSIRDGVQSGDSAIPMPALGGNPALTEADIYVLINYMRQNFDTDNDAASSIPGEKQ